MAQRVIRNTERGDLAIRFLESILFNSDGSKLKFLDYQADFIRDIVEPSDEATADIRLIRKAVLSGPKKIGKSFLTAALTFLFAIHPDFGERNGSIYIAANARHQAKIIFDDILKFIRANSDLQAFFEITESTYTIRVIAGPCAGTVIKVISADAGTQQGLRPTLAIMDELGEAPNNKLFNVLSYGTLSNPKALLVAISTQNHQRSHFFTELLAEALDYDIDTREHKPIDRINRTMIGRLYCGQDGASILDEDNWFKANPALGKTIRLEDFRAEAEKASRTPSEENDFRRYMLNERVNGSSALFTKTILKAVLPPKVPSHFSLADDFDDGEEVFLGLDMASKIDLAALVAISASGLIKAWFWKPDTYLQPHWLADGIEYPVLARQGWLNTSSGMTIDPEDVAQTIIDLNDRYKIRALAYDRAKIDEVKRLLGRQLPLVEYKKGEFVDYRLKLTQYSHRDLTHL